MSIYRKYIDLIFDDYLENLGKLVKIASVSDESKSVEGKPFGEEVFEVFEQFKEIAFSLGFDVKNDEGYAISVSTDFNEDDYVGVLGHLDVVEAGNLEEWRYSPFELNIDGGVVYGRGVNDDKGPLLANLYALKIIKDMGYRFRHPVRIIAGGAEETTWHCMDYYFQKHKQPIMAYSPDGNFPIVNGEKGIITLRYHYDLLNESTVEIVNVAPNGYAIAKEIVINDNKNQSIYFSGSTALTRNPHKADNALFKMAEYVVVNQQDFDATLVKLSFDLLYFAKDPFGKGFGFYCNDEEMGFTTIAPFNLLKDDDGYSIDFDIRYPKGITEEEIISKIDNCLQLKGKIIRHKRILFVEKDSELISKLSSAYGSVMNEEPLLLTKGGASYARVLENGIAFGATFDGYDTKPHSANENMLIEDIKKGMEIYCEALVLLSCEKDETKLPQ